jgi:UDP-2,3-diacylglucosamine pyrophosphatase LpxH
MLVVISDLHFEEVATDAIGPRGEVTFGERNLSPLAFEVLFRDLADSARRDRAARLDLVLAGDVFDLHRTSLWFQGELRPYVDTGNIAPGSPLEKKVLEILAAIAAETSVAASLKAIRGLGTRAWGSHGASGVERQEIETRVHYLPGNHDRLVNATPATRAKVRELLGLEGGTEPFGHVFESDDPRVLIRHGHEYDPLNFGAVFPQGAPIPVHVPLAAYRDWTFGDFITVDVAVGLPHAFREVHGSDRIAGDAMKSTVYKRLLEFDDVRPQSQLVPFLLSIPGYDPGLVWKVLEPVVRRLLDRIAASPHLEAALRKGRVSPAWVALLETRAWRLGLPLWAVQRLGALAARGDAANPPAAAAREAAVVEGDRRFVIAGHTHHPRVALLSDRASFDRYFIDTGTWRNVVFSSGAGEFSNAKALTYVVVYSSREDAEGTRKGESFDYWSGYTKRW